MAENVTRAAPPIVAGTAAVAVGVTWFAVPLTRR